MVFAVNKARETRVVHMLFFSKEMKSDRPLLLFPLNKIGWYFTFY